MRSQGEKGVLLVSLCVLLVSVLSACQSGPMSQVQRVHACNTQVLPGVKTFRPVASLTQTVYAASGSHLYALQASNGTPRWCRALTLDNGQPDRFVGITHFGDQLYAFTDAGTLTALTAHAGAEVWSTTIESLEYSLDGLSWTHSPSAANGVVYAGGTSIVALRSQDGLVRWHYSLPHNFVATIVPVESNGTVYVADEKVSPEPSSDPPSQLVALDAATGTRRWIFSSPSGVFGPDLIIGGGVVVTRYTTGEPGTAEFRTGLDVVDAQSGKLLWHNDSDAILRSNQNITNGLLYVLASFPSSRQDTVGGLYAYDLRTGMVRWSLLRTQDTDLNLEAPLVVSNNLLYTIDDSGEVNAIDVLTGQILWRAPLSDASETPFRLVLSENELFLVAENGTGPQLTFVLHALNVTTRTENWQANLIDDDGELFDIDVGI